MKAPPKLNLAPSVATTAYTPDISLLTPLVDKIDYIKAVVYGDHGVGKTSSLASLASQGRVVIVDTEDSVRRSALASIGIQVGNISLWPDWTYDGIQQLYVTVKAQLEEEPGSIYAVGIDTGTALSHYWLEASVKESLARPAMQKKHPDRPQWDVFKDDYGVLAQKMQAAITRQLYTLPCHVVIACHARRAENESGIVRVGPDLSPAVQQSILTYSDWVLQLTAEESGGEVVRWARSQPAGQVEAKDRFNVLPNRMKNYDLQDMIALWEESHVPF